MLLKVALCASLLASAGCRTASLEDAAPVSAVQSASSEKPAANGVVENLSREQTLEIAAQQTVGPQDSGEFPNLNIAPVRHASQISKTDEAADIRRLTQQREQLAAGAATDNAAALAESERLRQLGHTHAETALQAIEGQ